MGQKEVQGQAELKGFLASMFRRGRAGGVVWLILFFSALLWNFPQKQMADPVFANRPFSCSGKVW